MANKLLAKMMKEKAFADMLRTEQKPIEWLSTNCISVNLLLSGKIKGGIKKGSISMIAAGSGWGKSMNKPVCDLVCVRHCVKLALCQGWGHKCEQGQLFVFEELTIFQTDSWQLSDN